MRRLGRPSVRSRAGAMAKATAIVPIGLLVSGCLATPASTQSDQISALYAIFVVASAVVLAIVWGLLTWSSLRHRRRSQDAASGQPPQTRGNVRVEVIWTALPALTVAVLFIMTAVTLSSIQPPPADPAVRLRVIGFQWGWRFEYLDEGVEVSGTGLPGPEAVLPVGEPIELSVTGADVIHSFYVPRFLAKYDGIPGRDYNAPLLIKEPGIYSGQCAEFCGIYHSQMGFTIRAVPPDEYRAWITAQPKVTAGAAAAAVDSTVQAAERGGTGMAVRAGEGS